MINLGAGLQQADSWIGYDRSRSPLIARSSVLRGILRALHAMGLTSRKAPLSWPDTTRVHDVTKGIPHADGSVDVIYSSHMLEHLHREEVAVLLAECFRVLRPGAWIRLVVPDLAILAGAYASGDRTYFRNDEPTIADAFVRSLELQRQERAYGRFERLARHALRTDDGGHRWMYDAESLGYRMRAAGFTDIESAGFQKGRCQAAAAMDTQSRSSIYLEGRKPGRESPFPQSGPVKET